MKNNVVLIGMPGAGKSTVGIVLAKLLGYCFLDSDLVIQEAEGRLLKDIIEQEGIARFIEIEEKINAEIRAEHTVIATGGSVVYGKKRWKICAAWEGLYISSCPMRRFVLVWEM